MSARVRLVAVAACAVIALVGTAFSLRSAYVVESPGDPMTAPEEEGRYDRSDRPSDLTPRSCGPAGARPYDPSAQGRDILSNGCAVSLRGIPECGTLLGSSLDYNADPSSWERSMGEHLGVRRTYYQASQVDRALDTVKADTAVGRIPWISFKTPYSWQGMVAGKGDAWARDLATRLSQVDGPVWLAIHHEPENDGDIVTWTKMQERLAPIVRQTASNVAYSIILTGWNQWYGSNPDFRLDSLYPDSKIDLVGFDIYNKFGNENRVTIQTNMKERFFDKIALWARSRGVAWGLAETGYRGVAAHDMPEWLSATYDQMVATGGVALTYFNFTLDTGLDSDFSLRDPAKAETFTNILLRSPKLKGRPIPDGPCSSATRGAGGR